MKRVNRTSQKTVETTGNEIINKNGSFNIITEEKGHKQKRIMEELKLQRIHDNIKILQKETLNTIDCQISALMDSVIGELERFEKIDTEDCFFTRKAVPEKRIHGHAKKQFIARASPLSELMEVRHIRSLYHIFIAALIISMITGATGDALKGGWTGIRIGIRLLPTIFAQINRTIILWIIMFTATCLIHPLLSYWMAVRPNINKYLLWCFDRLCISFIIAYIGIIIGILVVYCSSSEMGSGSKAILCCEQARFCMKIHAFLRSNIPRYPALPLFSHYLYFLFAPTLLYRDEYPRTSHIRWRFVGSCLTEFLGAILMQSCIAELHFLPEFSKFGLEKQTAGTLAASIFRSMLPASLFTLCAFYLLLHAWMNIWAELLRFADRRFYSTWWNATSYGEYYRTWNCVVHDYIYEYIFQDVLSSTKNSSIAKIAVFAVSAIVHEYIIAFALGFCYPVTFVLFFGFGTVLLFVRGHGRCANIFLWGSLAGGLGILFSLYTMETFARINCPKNNTDFIDYFVPTSWTCNGLHL